jgi:hypothetical protein
VLAPRQARDAEQPAWREHAMRLGQQRADLVLGE